MSMREYTHIYIRQAAVAVAVAAVLWFVMFSPVTAGRVNFWAVMTFSALSLTILSTVFCREWTRDIRFSLRSIFAGVAMALVLWCVFYVGGQVTSALFSFARPEVDMIYSTRAEASSWAIALLLLLVIGPAEEIFWRGFVQRRLSQVFSPDKGFVFATLLYTVIHVWALNPMLLAAAFTAGLFWGGIYRIFPKSLSALIISHALWDALAFVIIPF